MGCGRRCTSSRSAFAIASAAPLTPVRTRAVACRRSFASSRSPASRASRPVRSSTSRATTQPGDGEWHDTPDKEWRWKGDTSSDEIVGNYFVYPLYLELVADESEKPELRAVIDRITNHILDNDYQLMDVDGQRTTWGWWGPDAIWEDPDETGLRALHILSHLQVAIHMTASDQYRARYQAAYDGLVKTHKYHWLTRNQKVIVPGSINHSDDELAFLSYYPLLRYEKDPALARASTSRASSEAGRSSGRSAIRSGTSSTRLALARRSSIVLTHCVRCGRFRWTRSSGQSRTPSGADVPIDPLSDRFKRRQALIVLPYDELPMWKWNGNPYNLDGGDGGRSEDDGAYFLLPYWMGRYHQLIVE